MLFDQARAEGSSIGEWDRACLWALIHNLFSRRAAQ
jgi:hypothetical protein